MTSSATISSAHAQAMSRTHSASRGSFAKYQDLQGLHSSILSRSIADPLGFDESICYFNRIPSALGERVVWVTELRLPTTQAVSESIMQDSEQIFNNRTSSQLVLLLQAATPCLDARDMEVNQVALPTFITVPLSSHIQLQLFCCCVHQPTGTIPRPWV